jgi:prepilin-type N-terminal cleavage/methylation domain-containing protein
MREIIRETKKHDFRKDSGFTLIEILVSLAILLLVAMFILPMVFQGFKMLEKSSHKRLVLANESGMLQIVHASQEGLWFSDGTWVDEPIFLAIEDGEFPVRFMNGGAVLHSRDVEGGMVRKGDLVHFLAKYNPPRVILNPKMLVDGYYPNSGNSRLIEVTGKNTHFTSGITQISILDARGNSYEEFSFSINSQTKIELYFPAGTDSLSSANSPYTITFKTGNEKAKNLLHVETPYLVAVGGDGNTPSLLVSADIYEARYWEERPIADKDGNNLAVGQLNAVTYHPMMKYFVAVGDNARIIYSSNARYWEEIENSFTNNLNDIIYYEADESDAADADLKFIAVGDNSTIIYYPDDSGGIASAAVPYKPGEMAGRHLHSVSRVDFKSSDYKYIAVGEKGTILYSKDGMSWEEPWDYLPFVNNAGDYAFNKGNLKLWLNQNPGSYQELFKPIYDEDGEIENFESYAPKKMFCWFDLRADRISDADVDGGVFEFGGVKLLKEDDDKFITVPPYPDASGNGVYFTGSQYLKTNTDVPIWGSANRSIYMALKPDDANADTLLAWGSRDPSLPGNVFVFRLDSTASQCLRAEFGGGYNFPSSLFPELNETSIVGLRLDGDKIGDVSLFLNGRYEKKASNIAAGGGTDGIIDTQYNTSAGKHSDVIQIASDVYTRSSPLPFCGHIAELIVFEHQSTDNNYFRYWGRRSIEKYLLAKHNAPDEEKIFSIAFTGDEDSNRAKYFMAGNHGAFIAYHQNTVGYYEHNNGFLNLQEINSNIADDIRSLCYDSGVLIGAGYGGKIIRQFVDGDLESGGYDVKTFAPSENNLYAIKIYRSGKIDPDDKNNIIQEGTNRIVALGSNGTILYSDEVLDEDISSPQFDDAIIAWINPQHTTLRGFAHRFIWEGDS